MLKITFTEKREDFVINQLFASSKLLTVGKTRTKSRVRVPILYVLLALMLFAVDATDFAIGFTIIAVVWYLFYPLLIAKTYQKSYTKHVDEVFANRFDQTVTVVFADEYIGTETSFGLAKLYNTAVERIDEIADYCFVKFKSGELLFIPLNQLAEKAEVLAVLAHLSEKYAIPYHTDLNWKWK